MYRDVIRIIEILEFRRAPVEVKREVVRDWVSSMDPNVMSAAADALLMHPQCIRPSLEPGEVFEALLKNFELNLSTEKPPTPYGTSCYQAARDLYSWLIAAAAANRAGVPGYLSTLKRFIEKAYVAAGENERRCIQNGLLEHLFEHEPFREVFDDWRGVPMLGDAFENAMRWSEWVREQIAALEEVAERTATRLRDLGRANACLMMPSVGSAVVSVAWETGELWLSCDEEWVKLARQKRIRLDDAVKFCVASQNWTADPVHAGTFTVELLGARFAGS